MKLIVREVFVAKPGQASKLAKLMKEMMNADPKMAEGKVMTDLVGNYNTVVFEYPVPSLSDFEKDMEEYGKNMDPELAKKMTGYTDMYMEGRREIWRIVE